MSTNRDFDRIASAWLAEGPSELADRVLDQALAEVHLTRQRRRLSVVPWRNSLMSLSFRFAAGIAILAIVSAGVYLSARQASVGAACPSATISSLAEPTPDAKGRIPTAVGHVVDYATYVTSAFRPKLEFDVPIQLDGIVEENAVGIRIERAGSVWQVYAPTSLNDPATPASPLPSGALPKQIPLPKDLGAWLLTDPVLAVTEVAPITIDGIAGRVFDGTLSPVTPLDGLGYYEMITVPCQTGPGFGFFGRDHFRIIVLAVRGTPVLIGESADNDQWSYTGPGADNFERVHATFHFPTD
jgi:hypothetical protein